MLRGNRGRGVRGAEGQLKLIEGLMDGVSRARLDSALTVPLPTSLNMLWLVEHATVRANKVPAPSLDAPLPKKRAAWLSDRVRRVRA